MLILKMCRRAHLLKIIAPIVFNKNSICQKKKKYKMIHSKEPQKIL